MSANTLLGLSVAVLLVLPVCAASGERGAASQWQIVVPDSTSPPMDYTASELKQLLEKVSGAVVPVVRERNAGRTPSFLLGPTRRAARAGLVAKANELGADGVLIRTVGKDVVLLGRGERGQLYSVYVLLERYFGCRFLARDCTVTPKRGSLSLPKIDYSYSPQFVYRETLYNDASYWDFAARQKLNGANMNQCLQRPFSADKSGVKGILIFPFVHSSCALIPTEKYFATHPEYFGLVKGQRHGGVIGGQLCFTNPDVLKICTDQVLAWLTEHPETWSVDVSQNDAYPGSSGACECENCAAIVKEEGAQHGPILRFVNAIADVVAKKCPGKLVDTLAYDYTIATPKVTKPRDNVVIRLCHYGCYFHGVENEAVSADYRKAIDDWRKVAKNLFIWHYGVNFWSYIAPNPNLNGLAKDIKYYAAHGVNGVMVQGDIQSPGGELAELRQYLASQLMWDPAQDPMAIRTDFCKGYYGSASDDALEFLALMDKLAETNGKHISPNGWNPPDVATPAFVSAGLAILNRTLGKAGDEVYRNRVEKLMLPLWFVELAWPDTYGLSKENGRTVLAQFKKVLNANSITTISEGPPNADDFVTRMEGVYGTGSSR